MIERVLSIRKQLIETRSTWWLDDPIQAAILNTPCVETYKDLHMGVDRLQTEYRKELEQKSEKELVELEQMFTVQEENTRIHFKEELKSKEIISELLTLDEFIDKELEKLHKFKRNYIFDNKINDNINFYPNNLPMSMTESEWIALRSK